MEVKSSWAETGHEDVMILSGDAQLAQLEISIVVLPWPGNFGVRARGDRSRAAAHDLEVAALARVEGRPGSISSTGLSRFHRESSKARYGCLLGQVGQRVNG